VDVHFLFASPYLRTNTKDYFYMNIYINYVKSMIDLRLADAKDSGNMVDLEFSEK
jgi:hypothetical protein